MGTRAIVGCAVALTAGSALAGPVFVGETVVTKHFGAGVANGGEFTATTTNWSIAPVKLDGLFETFCMERFEDLTLGPTDPPLKADMNETTVAASNNSEYSDNPLKHGGDHDTLDDRTAWLYAAFITHTLAGFDYGNGAARNSSADAFQLAIWLIEEEGVQLDPNGLAQKFVNDATAAVNNGYHNSGNVKILNLYTHPVGGDRREFQDVLVMLSVPLPTAGMSGVAMLAALGFVRRRRA